MKRQQASNCSQTPLPHPHLSRDSWQVAGEPCSCGGPNPPSRIRESEPCHRSFVSPESVRPVPSRVLPAPLPHFAERSRTMDQLPALGTSIATSVLPTVQLYKSVLAPLAAGFIKPQELTYGPHPRHHLDVFLPPAPEELLPVILFVHGGGFDKGAKRLPHVEGAYQNVGNFFARQGFLSVSFHVCRLPRDNRRGPQIVLNYRLVGPEIGRAHV